MAKVNNNTFTGIEDSLYTAFATMGVGTGYFINQNGVQPPSPYCNIYVITETQVGMPEESSRVDGTTRTTLMRQTWQSDVRFTFIGKDAQAGAVGDKAQNLADSFNMKIRMMKYRQVFADNGLSILRVSAMRRSKASRENDVYSAYAVDVTIAYEKQQTIGNDTIDHGQIIGTFTEANNEDGSISKTITF